MSEGGGRILGEVCTVRAHLGLILSAHGLKLLAALPISAAVGRLVHVEMGPSLEAERFAAALEPALLLELLRRVEPALGPGLYGLVAALPVLALLMLFLDGALIAAFVGESPTVERGSIFALGGRALGPLLRFLPLGLLLLLALGLLPVYGLHRLGLGLTEAWRDERAVFGVRLGLLVLGGLCFLHVKSCHGVARVHAVRGASARMTLRAFVRALARPRAQLARVLPWGLALLLSTAALSLLDVRIGRSSELWVVCGILVQQASGLLRTLGRAGLIAAEATLAGPS